MPLEVNLMVLVDFAPVLVKGQGQGQGALARRWQAGMHTGGGGDGGGGGNDEHPQVLVRAELVRVENQCWGQVGHKGHGGHGGHGEHGGRGDHRGRQKGSNMNNVVISCTIFMTMNVATFNCN